VGNVHFVVQYLVVAPLDDRCGLRQKADRIVQLVAEIRDIISEHEYLLESVELVHFLRVDFVDRVFQFGVLGHQLVELFEPLVVEFDQFGVELVPDNRRRDLQLFFELSNSLDDQKSPVSDPVLVELVVVLLEVIKVEIPHCLVADELTASPFGRFYECGSAGGRASWGVG